MIHLIRKIQNLVTQYSIYFKSTFLYLLSSLVPAAIGIAINPLMAINLSPEDYAIIGYFNSFNLILLPLLSFSLITYYLKNYYSIPDQRRQIVSDTIVIALLVYGFVALLVVYSIFYLYCKFSKVTFSFYPYTLLTFVPIFFNNFQNLFLVQCRLNRNAGKYSKIIIYNVLLSTVLAIILVVIYKYGATGRLMATFIASVVTAIYCFKKMLSKYQFDFNVIKDAIKFGWPLTISAILWYFLFGIDRLMLEKLNSPNTFGFYNVAIQITAYFTIFHTAITQTFEPDIYKAIADDKKRKLAKLIGSIMIFNALPNIIFIFFAPFIVALLTYDRYTDASEFAQILSLKNITISAYYLVVNVMIGYGFTKAELLIRLLGSAICIGMFSILIDNYGFYGAAWGQVLAFIVVTIIAVLFLLYQFKLKLINIKNIKSN